jgi:CRP/FNR family transcriptional regulator, cyclic AMP receptor protein
MAAPPEFVHALDEQAQSALLSGHARTAHPGEVLMSEGEPPDSVLVLLAGRVKVTVTTGSGATAVLAFRGPGALLGEHSALDGSPRGATVTAIEPLEYVAMAASRFRRHLRESPDTAIALITHVGAHLRYADRRRAEHLAGDTSARVAARLVELAEQYGVPEGAHVRIELPLTQSELAGWSGSSLEAVAKALRTLRTAGWLETGRREMTLRDVEALRRLAGAG